MTEVVGHFLVFTVLAIVFLITPLLIGKLVRPRLPTPEKDASYECGEPTIGSSYIQFDLRFYVVALLFIIFDVEVVFFFPWATVFGTTMQLADPALSLEARRLLSEQLLSANPGSVTHESAISAATALKLGWTAFIDVAAFFAVLLVGFAYVWKRGDLDWVRSTIEQKNKIGSPAGPLSHLSTKKTPPVTAS
ncbi:NADH-quinone oxidoreductase subunit A [Schlesneria sp. DSM 10557]|uniref:NADH-quinone oxidoreductase subunit A n=1 Tax=Schlesneria sp. DSM 10557 TaxID=3044399 RepID=UPI0035A0CAD2